MAQSHNNFGDSPMDDLAKLSETRRRMFDMFEQVAAMKQQQDEMYASMKDLNHHLTGNGTPEKGVLFRLANMEDREKARTWWMKTAATAAIGAIVLTGWDLMRSGGAKH
jgi:ferric-dicitrate binding protein FerR (iron transport regulator)